mgnify:CR=1 FL=1
MEEGYNKTVNRIRHQIEQIGHPGIKPAFRMPVKFGMGYFKGIRGIDNCNRPFG